MGGCKDSQNVFMYHLGVENRRSKGAYLCVHIDHEAFSKPL